MIDRGGAGGLVGQELLWACDDLFLWWHALQQGDADRPLFDRKVNRLRSQVRSQVRAGVNGGCTRAAGTCAEILKVEAALGTLTRVEGIEPTNNAAARALRHAVLWRKLSHGTASAGGSRFVSSILSVVETCRQQGRNVLEFLATCTQAALDKVALPSLLPQINL
jgi:transposase